eukprot:CAMPEP_0170547040 /NCGR_PEP_ID=MMETSP0211-20121228/5397_1 /TAXON_ID=311385 /ORGANISM="Pseudokeronopsis sp., Strain OXSARD2" /LENGTH=126 /DNA_ID=CAMNT_0010851827 /DNA_START=577 /DNA_END=957 /DNA_ORIENTATION=+
MELTPEHKRVFAGTYFWAIDAFTNVYMTLYFEFISKIWTHFFWFVVCLNILVLLNITFLFPESPKYYYGQKRFDESRKVFNYIGKMNGSKETITQAYDVEVALTESAMFEKKKTKIDSKVEQENEQ